MPGAEKLVLETLAWLGIKWDEGPTLSGRDQGNFAPYHQTARREIYYRYAKQLVANGFAYADPTSTEEIDVYRKECERAKKPFLFRDIRPDNPPVWTPDCGLPLRFCAKKLKVYHWHDEVFGDLSAGAEALDDFIMIKSDGLPTYNFAHIVDDHEMKITHVIRGAEYLASMPKYLSLYDALDIKWPTFAHLPHILAPDGKKKLGKRDGAKSVSEYRADGYLPEAMVNFLALLGWNPGNGSEQEIFSLDELIHKFDLSHVQKSGARFDEKRLAWLNGQWIRRLELNDLYNRCEAFWGDHAKAAGKAERKKVLAVVQERLKTLCDLPVLTEYFFVRPKPDWSMMDENKQLKKLSCSDLAELLQITRKKLAGLDTNEFNDTEALQAKLNELLIETAQKPTTLFSTIRYALTWAPFSPGLPETMTILGQAETLARLDDAINTTD